MKKAFFLHDETMLQPCYGYTGQGAVPDSRRNTYQDLLRAGICGYGGEETDGVFR